MQLTEPEMSDVALVLNGAFAPLHGFLPKADYQRVVDEIRLTSGAVWSIPITLSVSADTCPALDTTVDLFDRNGALRARLDVEEIFPYDKTREARQVYGTEDATHPGVAALYAQGEL